MTNRIIDALAQCPLYFILDRQLCWDADPVETCRAVLQAGVRVIQLRMKDTPEDELTELAARLKQIEAPGDWLLIINDNVAAALASGADGVHLGMADMPVSQARDMAPGLVIGATARYPAGATEAEQAGADYLGCGSVFASRTKPGLPLIGTEGLAEVAGSVGIPVVAIGGIDQTNVSGVIDAGAAGFCAISPFVTSTDPGETVAELLKAAQAKGEADAH